MKQAIVKKPAAPQPKAVVPRPADLKKQYLSIMQQLSQALTVAKEPEQLAVLADVLAVVQEDVEALKDGVRMRVLAALEKEGEVVGDNGTRVLERGGWKLEARRTGGGMDPKKVEGALRAKSIDPSKYMQPEVTFSVEPALLEKARLDGVFTQDELELLRRKVTYALQRPIRTEEL